MSKKSEPRKLDLKADLLYPMENAAVDTATGWVVGFTRRAVNAGLNLLERKMTGLIDTIRHGEVKALQYDNHQKSKKKSKGSR